MIAKNDKTILKYFWSNIQPKNEARLYAKPQPYPQLDDALQFRISRIKEIERFYIVKINDRVKMTKTDT